MDFFEKIEQALKTDLAWNIPERKQGSLNVIGGNSQNFRQEVKIAEYMGTKYPIEQLNLVLPESLKKQLPDLPNLVFVGATESGSFEDEDRLKELVNSADFNLFLGDFSKNSITAKVVASACDYSEKPLLVTRDAVDVLCKNLTEKTLLNENLGFFATMPQLIKILRTVYYPKMLLISQSLVQVVEVLHKFTLSFAIGIVTVHGGQILIAKNGRVVAVPFEKARLNMIMFWQGEMAARFAGMNLFNPNNFVDASVAAIFQK